MTDKQKAQTTDAQAACLKDLTDKARAPDLFDDEMTRDAAAKRIDQLRHKQDLQQFADDITDLKEKSGF